LVANLLHVAQLLVKLVKLTRQQQNKYHPHILLLASIADKIAKIYNNYAEKFNNFAFFLDKLCKIAKM
jgi:hypothetical protein